MRRNATTCSGRPVHPRLRRRRPRPGHRPLPRHPARRPPERHGRRRRRPRRGRHGRDLVEPAALGFVNKSAVELTYAQLVPGLATDVSYNYATFVKPLQGWGAFGVGLVFLSYGTERRDRRERQRDRPVHLQRGVAGGLLGTQLLPDFSIGRVAQVHPHPAGARAQSGVGPTFGLDVAGALPHPGGAAEPGRQRAEHRAQRDVPQRGREEPAVAQPASTGFAWEATSSKAVPLPARRRLQPVAGDARFRTYNGGVELKYTDQIAGRVGYYSRPARATSRT